MASLLAVALSLLVPALIVPDTWTALVSGREVWQRGIPDEDVLTVLSAGERWIDQQWAGQVVLYGAERLGGMPALGVLCVLLVVGTYASAMSAARLLGASARSTYLVAFVSLLVAPWAWQIRTQLLALPLFVWTLWLAADHVRRPSRRLLVAVPLLVLWANVHGSVLLGAGLVALAGLVTTVHDARHRAVSLASAAGALLAPLLTPYGADILDYYNVMLVDPRFATVVSEWQRTPFAPQTVPFLALAASAALLAARYRRRLTIFELAALAATLLLAFQAARGIVWFSLAVAVLVPNALDGLLGSDRIAAPRANAFVAVTAVAASVAAVAALALRPTSWFLDSWPGGAVRAVEETGPRACVFASERLADHLLWELPALRGRIAHDLRWELYSRDEIDRIAAFAREEGPDWTDVTKGYDVIVLDERPPRTHADAFEARGLRVLYRGDGTAVLVRPGARDTMTAAAATNPVRTTVPTACQSGGSA